MISSPYSRQDLLKTFMPLSESGKAYLEVLLVNPKTSKPEGRGYFNDLDFLLEASGPHVGRYNFCLSNFAYAPEQIPTRASCNQFDRTLPDVGQENGRAHSLSVALLFKPDLIREMGEQAGGNEQFLGIVYQIDGILGRLGLKSFSLDYFLTGMVARFCPAGALQRRPLGKTALAQASKRLMEAIEKQMTTQEQKRFALASAVHGKLWDPLPGLPGQFSGGGADGIVVTSSGALQPGEDSLFAALLEEALDGKGSRGERASQAEPYAPNIHGLSQGWSGEDYGQDSVSDIGKTIEMGKSFSAVKADSTGRKPAPSAREPSKEVVSHLQSLAQGRWRWPLASGIFNRVHHGSGCGEMLLLQCDPFAAALGFNVRMQCAEGLTREGTGRRLNETAREMRIVS